MFLRRPCGVLHGFRLAAASSTSAHSCMRFSSRSPADIGLELMDAGLLQEAFPYLREAIDRAATSANDDDDESDGAGDFPRISEVYFALGVMSSNDGAALLDGGSGDDGGDSPDPGAANLEEVLSQIKAARRAAIKDRQAQRRRTRGKSDEKTAAAQSEEGAGGLQTTKSSGGVTILTSPRLDEASFSSVEELVVESEKLSASFHQIAAARGHAGAMVALGNLALAAAEEHAAKALVANEAAGGSSALAAGAGRTLALEWYEAASGLGSRRAVIRPHGDGLFNLGQLYYTGRAGVVPVDLTRAVLCFERAAAAASSYSLSATMDGCNDSSAQYFLAHILRSDEDVQAVLQHVDNEERGGEGKDSGVLAATAGSSWLEGKPRSRPEDWLRLLQAAVTQGHGGAAYYLALLYRNGVEEGDESDEEGDWLDSSLDHGKGTAGPSSFEDENDTWQRGLEVRQSMARYRQLLRFAAEECGDRDALFCLADCYFNASDGFTEPAPAPSWWNEVKRGQLGGLDAKEGGGAAAGAAGKKEEMAVAHPAVPDLLDGPALALVYWTAAAERGHADAMCCLGAVHYRGLCGTAAAVPSEAERFRFAFEWYQRAADAAHVEGGPSLSELGWQAKGQVRMEEEGATQQQQQQQQQHEGQLVHGGEWAGAHREAWSNLASMYALGHGVPKCASTAMYILRFLGPVP